MWGGMVAHNGTCGVGCEEDWSGHQMEHELSAMYDVTHGAGLAVITPAYMEFMAHHHAKRIRQFAERVFAVPADFGSEEEIALEGGRRFRAFLHDDLHLPTTLDELLPSLSRQEIETAIPELVARLHKNKGEKFGAFYPITPDVSTEIYRIALK